MGVWNRDMKKAIIICVAILMLLLSGCCLHHEWVAATCPEPRTCSKCGKTEGEPLGHDWIDATCTAPKTCLLCGVTDGEPNGHNPESEITCTEGSVCNVCGDSLPALGHQWNAATCTTSKACSVCGITEGNPLGHDYTSATCTNPRTCKRCGETLGRANGHRTGDWKITDLASKGKAGTIVKKCTVCGEAVETEHYTLTDEELLAQYKSHANGWYGDVARNPQNYRNKYLFFSGTVVQVCSEATSSSSYSTYRVATYRGYDNVVFVYIKNYGKSRILEGDTISFYGIFDGLYSYKTVVGTTLTVPSVKVEVYCLGTVNKTFEDEQVFPKEPGPSKSINDSSTETGTSYYYEEDVGDGTYYKYICVLFSDSVNFQRIHYSQSSGFEGGRLSSYNAPKMAISWNTTKQICKIHQSNGQIVGTITMSAEGLYVEFQNKDSLFAQEFGGQYKQVI